MNLKDIILKETQNKPPRIVLHGPHGIGKSTFGAQAPSPIFLPTEDGLTSLKVQQFPLATQYSHVITYLDLLINEQHEYKTLVVDTIDWLETLIWTEVCLVEKKEHIEKIGYGKGYTAALQQWIEFLDKLNAIRNSGVAILLLAHNEVKPYSPPDTDGYDRYQIKLHKSAAAKVEEWADAVLFANYKIYVDGENKRAVSSGDRVIYTQPHPAWRAKNRYDLPPEMPFNFTELAKAIKGEK